MQFAHIADIDESVIVPKFSMRTGLDYQHEFKLIFFLNTYTSFIEINNKLPHIQFTGIQMVFIMFKSPDQMSNNSDHKFPPSRIFTHSQIEKF